jgi:hypothetical protein
MGVCLRHPPSRPGVLVRLRRIVIGSNGRFTVETGNRHEMVLRWLDRLRGKKHIRLVAERPAGQDGEPPN